jgi:hypothetical protein
MKNTIPNKKGQAGGIELVRQKGFEYLAVIGGIGSRKRTCRKGGRPHSVTLSDK